MSITLEQAIELYKNGMSITKIYKNYKFNRDKLSLELEKLGLKRKYFIRDFELDNKVCEMYKAGMKNKDISISLNIDRHLVTRILKENNIYEYPKSHINNSIKQNEELNLSIIKDYEILSLRDISKKYNLSTTAITNILSSYNIKMKQQQDYNRYNYNQSIFEKIDTEEKAYWLGFLYADGCITERKINITLQKSDYDHLIKFRKFIGDENIPIVYKESVNAYSITICSKNITNNLIDLGCFINKSLILKFPTLEQVPENLIHHFMRGYFDGDGCICVDENKLNKAHFSLIGTPDFLDSYEKYLLKGINRKTPNKRICRNDWSENTQKIQYSGNKQIYKIFQFLYKDATVFLERKFNKFKILMPSQDETDNNLEMISAELSGKTVTSQDTQPEPKASSDTSQGQRVDSDPSTDDRRV